MENKHSHFQRSLYGKCGHACTEPDCTLCDKLDCKRPGMTVKLIDSWCPGCCQSPSLWRLLGDRDKVDTVWKYWDGLHKSCDETTEPQLKLLWGPSKLDKIGRLTTARSSLIGCRTATAEEFWVERLCWAASFMLLQDANSVIEFKQGTDCMQHKRGNTEDVGLKAVIKDCINACVDEAPEAALT